jgi:hypothetical protein
MGFVQNQEGLLGRTLAARKGEGQEKGKFGVRPQLSLFD